MKYLLLLLLLVSCSIKKPCPGVSCKWNGRNTMVIIIDSTGKEKYEPAYIKIVLKKQKSTKKQLK